MSQPRKRKGAGTYFQTVLPPDLAALVETDASIEEIPDSAVIRRCVKRYYADQGRIPSDREPAGVESCPAG